MDDRRLLKALCLTAALEAAVAFETRPPVVFAISFETLDRPEELLVFASLPPLLLLTLPLPDRLIRGLRGFFAVIDDGDVEDTGAAPTLAVVVGPS